MSNLGTEESVSALAAGTPEGLSPLRQSLSGVDEPARSQLRELGAPEEDSANGIARKLGAVYRLGMEAEVAAVAWAVGTHLRDGNEIVRQLKRGAKAVGRLFSSQRTAKSPCVPCLGRGSAAERSARIDRRRALIAAAQGSPDPAARQAATQLGQDMHSVELARLSDNAYSQYDQSLPPADRQPPAPWRALSAAELEAKGIPQDHLAAAKGVVYQAPPDFPFEPKTVLAFRGTTLEPEDAITDHDQALGQETRQYTGARKVGPAVAKAWPDAIVTGHSLGGGKAMAAAIKGHLTGETFNTAGLHPNTVDLTPDQLAAHAADFVNVRAGGDDQAPLGDPLTAIELSRPLQTVVYHAALELQDLGRANAQAFDELGIDPTSLAPSGQRALATELGQRILHVTAPEAAKNLALSHGAWYIPPLVGEVRPVRSLADDGSSPSALGQHAIGGIVNGLEARKTADIRTLLAATGLPGPETDYIGPLR
jgi:hypothetical protein